jgi:dienelactone hydrolase
MRASLVLPLASVLLAWAPSALAARTFDAAGPEAVAVRALDASTQIASPTAAGPYPLIVASHGFSAGGDNQIGWARHFASWGFVVAVPSFPSPFSPDHAVNAGIIGDLVASLTGANAAANKVKPGPFGLEGHSAGGLATALAAAKISPSAVVLFDPVDAADAGKAAYASMCAPVLAIFAGPSSCNNQAGWRAFAKDTKSELISFGVKGSTHCDGENAPRGLCGTFCGGAASPARQEAYAHYATALFLAKLAGDARGVTALADAAVTADADLEGAVRAAATCVAAPGQDAGVPPSDGGTASSSSGGSSGATPPGATPGGSSGSDAGDPAAEGGPSDAGCGCKSAVTRADSAGLVAGLSGLLALVAAGRRRRRRD